MIKINKLKGASDDEIESVQSGLELFEIELQMGRKIDCQLVSGPG